MTDFADFSVVACPQCARQRVGRDRYCANPDCYEVLVRPITFRLPRDLVTGRGSPTLVRVLDALATGPVDIFRAATRVDR